MQAKLDLPKDWRLRRRADLSGGQEVAFDIFGDGPPVILVHGTPSREFEPLLDSMQTPVRILWGERDAWLDPAFARRLDELLPNSNLELIPEAGHFAMEDRPEEVARILVEFFADD